MSQNVSYSAVDPQMQLGAALANRNIQDFRLALQKGAIPTLSDNRNTTVFESALQTYGCAEFVEECLRYGSSANFINENNRPAIHFAADSCDPQILAAILRNNSININCKYDELTPLNSIVKHITNDNAADAYTCIKLLLEYGASVNIPDHRNTPILYILKNRKLDKGKKLELLKLFLAQPNLDLDNFCDGEERKILMQKYPDFILPNISTNISFETLLHDLENGDEANFLEHYRRYPRNISEADNLHNLQQEQNVELLFKSIKVGLQAAFEEILQSGVNINAVHSNCTAVQLAAVFGNWRALKTILENVNLKIREEDHLLISVLRKMDYTPSNDFEDYRKCFELLLDSHLIGINEPDDLGLTALHYAVHDRNVYAQRVLLERGAYIGNKSAFNELPIQGMRPDILSEHFDNCISTNNKKCGDEEFEIIMNFTNLIPAGANQTSGRYTCSEMEPIAFMAESKDHLQLLQHPLITSYLFLKWHRLSTVFYLNFLMYSFFAISIVTYTLLKFRESEHEAVTTLFCWFSWIGIIYVLLREIMQLAMATRKYICSSVNLMELALIIFSIATCIETSFDKEIQRLIAVVTMLLVSIEFCLLVGSLPVLSISTHMLMLRAVLKSFLRSFMLYSIFVITFSLCFYILIGKSTIAEPNTPEPEHLICKKSDDARAPSEDEANNTQLEHLLCKKSDDSDPRSDDENDSDFNKFPNPLMAVIKTIVMLTGEFDANDINLATVSSLLFFLLFVLFMSIVLFNLLNGLAVSDTQAIRQQAELNGSICRANLLKRYEEVFVGPSYQQLFITRPFSRMLQLHQNYLQGTKISILLNDNYKIMIPTYQTEANGVWKNQTSHNADIDTEKQIGLLGPSLRNLPCCCSCIAGRCSVMDSRTVKLAMAVIEEKRNRVQSTDSRLQNIEEEMKKIFVLLKQLQSRS